MLRGAQGSARIDPLAQTKMDIIGVSSCVGDDYSMLLGVYFVEDIIISNRHFKTKQKESILIFFTKHKYTGFNKKDQPNFSRCSFS